MALKLGVFRPFNSVGGIKRRLTPAYRSYDRISDMDLFDVALNTLFSDSGHVECVWAPMGSSKKTPRKMDTDMDTYSQNQKNI
jgi:hypothetical protein